MQWCICRKFYFTFLFVDFNFSVVRLASNFGDLWLVLGFSTNQRLWYRICLVDDIFKIRLGPLFVWFCSPMSTNWFRSVFESERFACILFGLHWLSQIDITFRSFQFIFCYCIFMKLELKSTVFVWFWIWCLLSSNRYKSTTRILFSKVCTFESSETCKYLIVWNSWLWIFFCFLWRVVLCCMLRTNLTNIQAINLEQSTSNMVVVFKKKNG